jgi:hypothetical protein
VKIEGASLLNKYHNASPAALITAVYPEYKLLPWRFTRNTRSYWDIVGNQKKFIDWAAQQLNIKDYSDWYKVVTKVTQEISNNNNVTRIFYK